MAMMNLAQASVSLDVGTLFVIAICVTLLGCNHATSSGRGDAAASRPLGA